MKNKLIVGGISAVILLGAVYVGGVYYTGIKVTEQLEKVDSMVASNSQVQSAVPGLKLEYKEQNSSLFSKSGVMALSYPDEDGKTQSFEIPVFINNGFASSTITLNSKNFNLDLDIEALKLDKNSQQFDVKVTASRFSDNVHIDGNFTSKYENAEFGTLSAKLLSDITTDEHIHTNLLLSNLKNTEGSLDTLKVESRMQGFSRITDIGESRIEIEGLNAGLNSFKNMIFTANSANKDKNGNFDLNMTLKGDNLAGYAYDYDIDVTLSSLNVNDFNSYYEKGEKSAVNLFKNLNHLDIRKLDCRLSPVLGAFIGLPDLDKVKLNSSGKFDWDVKLGFDSVVGTLTVGADTNKNLERFFVEKDGKYQAVLKLENSRLFINDMPYM